MWAQAARPRDLQDIAGTDSGDGGGPTGEDSINQVARDVHQLDRDERACGQVDARTEVHDRPIGDDEPRVLVPTIRDPLSRPIPREPVALLAVLSRTLGLLGVRRMLSKIRLGEA